MARRRNNDSFIDLLALLPWWLTLIAGLGILAYRKIHPAQNGQADVQAMVYMFGLAAVQYMCFIASAVSALATLKSRLTFASAKDIDAIRAMSWREFETLVGEAYRRKGYEVEETGGGGADGGVDLILRERNKKILVQCKHWRMKQVGVKVVREMVGIIGHERADAVIIVTSGTFTDDALAFARSEPVELVNGKALVELIREARGQAATGAAAPAPALASKLVTPMTAPAHSSLSASAPPCPKCGSAMVLRTARKGANAGNSFWGCQRYPACKGVANCPKEQEIADKAHLR